MSKNKINGKKQKTQFQEAAELTETMLAGVDSYLRVNGLVLPPFSDPVGQLVRALVTAVAIQLTTKLDRQRPSLIVVPDGTNTDGANNN